MEKIWLITCDAVVKSHGRGGIQSCHHHINLWNREFVVVIAVCVWAEYCDQLLADAKLRAIYHSISWGRREINAE